MLTSAVDTARMATSDRRKAADWLSRGVSCDTNLLFRAETIDASEVFASLASCSVILNSKEIVTVPALPSLRPCLLLSLLVKVSSSPSSCSKDTVTSWKLAISINASKASTKASWKKSNSEYMKAWKASRSDTDKLTLQDTTTSLCNVEVVVVVVLVVV